MQKLGLLVALAGALGLAACGGGSGGGDDVDEVVNLTTFDTLQTDFDTLFTSYGGVEPTPRADMPLNGSATFAGTAVYSDVDNDPRAIIANPTSASAVELTADFAGAAVGGRLYDFRAADQGVSMDGELDIVNGVITENAFIANIDGVLTVDGASADHSGGVMLGSFVGSGAGAVTGPIVQGTSPTVYNGAFIASR